MHLEATRALIDWMKYGTNGSAGAADGPGSANAMIAALSLDGADPAPAHILTFGDETRTAWLARRTLPRDSELAYPVLGALMTESSDLDGEVETIVRDGLVSVTLAYANQQAVTEDAVRDWRYTCRALQRSVKIWMLNNNAAFRSRNNVFVMACMNMTVMLPFGTNGDLVFAGGLTLRLSVRDSAP